MNNLLNKTEAIKAALNQMNLDANQTRLMNCELCAGYYYIELRTDWMWYECCIGAVSGNLLGSNYEPSVDVDGLDGVLCAELFSEKAIAA